MGTAAVERVRLVFSLLDTDGNGCLEAADFDLMARRVIEAAPDSTEAAKQSMQTAFRRYWTTLATELDEDCDGRITFDEYSECVLSPKRFDATISHFAQSLAALGDPGGEGAVGRPVFVTLMTAIGFAPENVNDLFDAFGPSEADRIATSTWITGIEDYYRPDRTRIPGDRLVAKTTV